MRVLNQRGVSRVLVAASVVALMPVLARAQVVPPPPGPYQAMPQIPAMQGMVTPAPSGSGAPAAVSSSQQPSATQIWAPPPAMQMPYWMRAPISAGQHSTSAQGGASPAASPEPRSGGAAVNRQLSPAGRTATPMNAGQVAAPAYGGQIGPGYFPGYGYGQYGYPPYPGQMAIPYWAMPPAPAYGSGSSAFSASK